MSYQTLDTNFAHNFSNKQSND